MHLEANQTSRSRKFSCRESRDEQSSNALFEHVNEHTLNETCTGDVRIALTITPFYPNLTLTFVLSSHRKGTSQVTNDFAICS